MVEKEDVGSWAHILGIKGTKIKYNNNHISLYSKYIPQYIGVIYGDNTLRRFNFEEMEKNVYEAMVEYIPFCKDNIKAIFIVYSNMLSIDDINSLSKKDWLFDAEIETGECANYENTSLLFLVIIGIYIAYYTILRNFAVINIACV